MQQPKLQLSKHPLQLLNRKNNNADIRHLTFRHTLCPVGTACGLYSVACQSDIIHYFRDHCLGYNYICADV